MSASPPSMYLEWLDDAKQFAVEAAQVIREKGAKRDAGTLKIENKMTVDFVTEADKASEDIIVKRIRTKYPTHKIIGEEGGFQNGEDKFTNDPTWVIDPLDGTTNFCHNFPQVAVCIGICVDKIPVVGVVYDVYNDSMYYAAKGSGAFKNDQRLKCKSVKKVSEALYATNLGPCRDPEWCARQVQRYFLLSTLGFHSLRMNGSCALGMCSVADGSVDCFYEEDVGGPWDVMASTIIVREAGGETLNFQGKPLMAKVGKQKLISANDELARKTFELFNTNTQRHAMVSTKSENSDIDWRTNLLTFGVAMGGVLLGAYIKNQFMRRS